VSCGNASVLDPSEWILELARDAGVGSIALYLEADGDGARLCEALAVCAEHDVGVSVLKVGASATGAAAAAAHTGAVAGDHRVFRALVEEAGAAWAEDVHELLELAKAQAVGGVGPRARVRLASGLAILTCSGGDSALAADECARIGLPLPHLSGATAARLRDLLPEAATVANPLDYTALVWGEAETLRDIVVAVGADPAIEQVLVLYDQPASLQGNHAHTWAAVRKGILAGAEASRAPVLLSSTLPELLDDAAASRFIEAGVPAIAGLRTGLACAAALRRPPGSPDRLREIAEAAAAARRADGWGGAAAAEAGRQRAGESAGVPRQRAGEGAAPRLAERAAPPPRDSSERSTRPLAEHEVKELLRGAGVPVVDGRVAAGEDDAVRALDELGGRVALKLSSPALLHKTELGALALDLRSREEVRHAHRRLAEVRVEGAQVLVEQMAADGLEMLVAARRDAVVPALVVGLGGLWAEIHDDVAIVPLPARPERVVRALRSLRGAPLLTGGRDRPPLDLAALGELAAGVGDVLLDRGLSLVELNPVIVYEKGAVAVDAVAW